MSNYDNLINTNEILYNDMVDSSIFSSTTRKNDNSNFKAKRILTNTNEIIYEDMLKNQ